MWPNNRFMNFNINNNTNNNNINREQISGQSINSEMPSIDSKQLLLAANSIRTIFGGNLNNNLLNSISPLKKSFESDEQQSNVSGRHPIDYESDHFSRLGPNRLTSLSPNIDNRRIDSLNASNDFEYRETQSSFRTEKRFFDPTKMPQKSILKKSKDYSLESASTLPKIPNTGFHSIEEEDNYLYGCGPTVSKSLPPGIVRLEQRSEPNVERVMSPISRRLQQEMESIDWGRRPSPPKELADWPQILPSRDLRSNIEQLSQRNKWVEEEDNYQRRIRQNINRSPSPLKRFECFESESERVRYLQMADTLNVRSQPRDRNLSPPQRNISRDREIYRSLSPHKTRSPEVSPKRIRRRSPSLSPRRRSISPRYKRRRSRSRSSSRGRYRISRSRSRSGSRDRNPSRRRSRSPEIRKSPLIMSDSERIATGINPMNPMAPISPMRPMIPISSQGMGFMPSFGPRPPLRPPMYYSGPPMMPFTPMMSTPNVPQNVINPQTITSIPQTRTLSSLKTIPLTKTVSKSPKIDVIKKENKFINPRELLIAERSKLREELNSLKKQLERKVDEQKIIVIKDSGKNSYVFKQLESSINSIKRDIEDTHKKLEKNGKQIHELEKSKSKEKESVKKAKLKQTANLYDAKKKELTVSSQSKQSSSEVKKTEIIPKPKKKEEIDDDEDESSSRFHYFDSGPHWCKSCDKFFQTMSLYFEHIHSNEHLSKHKESERTPWKTKDYAKDNEKKVIRNKQQLVVAAKGIQFIYPTQGFYCELCKQMFVDRNQVETHFKSAKHNRSYTRYTLLHNDYESKWKSERDKAFTESKKREREQEKEKQRKQEEEKALQRKRLEEEINRKDKQVKDKIEAMHKNLKVVEELDAEKNNKIDDKNESISPKGIRLNLSNNNNERESKSNDSSKKDKSPKSVDKREKDKHKSSEKTDCENKKKQNSNEKDKKRSEINSKMESNDGSNKKESYHKSAEKQDKNAINDKNGLKGQQKSNETLLIQKEIPIEGMHCFVIDEINCDTFENITQFESEESLKISEQKIDVKSNESKSKEVLVSVELKPQSEDSSVNQIGEKPSLEKNAENKIEVSIKIESTGNQCNQITTKENINNSKTSENISIVSRVEEELKENKSSILEKSNNETKSDSKSLENMEVDLNNDLEKESKTNEDSKINDNKFEESKEEKVVNESKPNENSKLKMVSKDKTNDHLKEIEKSDESSKLRQNKEKDNKSKEVSDQKINNLSKGTKRKDSEESDKLKTQELVKKKGEEKRSESKKEERIESVESEDNEIEFSDELEGFDIIDSINDESVGDNQI